MLGFRARQPVEHLADQIEPLNASNAPRLRLSFWSRFDPESLAEALIDYPGRSVWLPETSEYAIVRPWRHRREIASIAELSAIRNPEPLVTAAAVRSKSMGANLLLMVEVEESRRPAFYDRIGLTLMEEVVTYELGKMPDLAGPNRIAWEVADVHNSAQLADLVAIDSASFPWVWRNSPAEFVEYSEAPGVEMLIGRLGGRPIACLGITSYLGWGHLDRVAVIPELQGSGYGAEAVRFALRRMAAAQGQARRPEHPARQCPLATPLRAARIPARRHQRLPPLWPYSCPSARRRGHVRHLRDDQRLTTRETNEETMSSSFGKIFRITTWGESHGPALGVIIEGCPAGIPLTVEDIQHQLNRRRVGQSEVTSPRNETDKAEILSGVFEGVTTGTPISLITYNKDVDSTKYENLRDVFRPGHADYTYWAKYGHRDHRGGGRSSARETWGRVAAGAIARKIIATEGTEVFGFVRELGGIGIETFDRDQIERNIVRSPDPIAAEKMIAAVLAAKDAHDSVGGVIEVRAVNPPVGLGEPTFDKIDGLIGQAMLSIPAVKAVEIGEGYAVSRMRGSQSNDGFVMENGKIRARSNNAGGTLGGITTGEDIVVRIVVKPTSSIAREQETVTTSLEPRTIVVEGRHDPAVAPRAAPIAEAMLAIVLADLMLRNRAARI